MTKHKLECSSTITTKTFILIEKSRDILLSKLIYFHKRKPIHLVNALHKFLSSPSCFCVTSVKVLILIKLCLLQIIRISNLIQEIIDKHKIVCQGLVCNVTSSTVNIVMQDASPQKLFYTTYERSSISNIDHMLCFRLKFGFIL